MAKIKFYAEKGFNKNYLYTFKLNKDSIFSANDAVQRILKKFIGVKAIFWEKDNGTSQKIYSNKK